MDVQQAADPQPEVAAQLHGVVRFFGELPGSQELVAGAPLRGGGAGEEADAAHRVGREEELRGASAERELRGAPQQGRGGVEIAGRVVERLLRDLDGTAAQYRPAQRRREYRPRVAYLPGDDKAAGVRLHHPLPEPCLPRLRRHLS
uniref:Uncharacterized protein n=1 Tax=Triticum urartu TaxID=4572 RepID=A0A8R7Q951_TRIUA